MAFMDAPTRRVARELLRLNRGTIYTLVPLGFILGVLTCTDTLWLYVAVFLGFLWLMEGPEAVPREHWHELTALPLSRRRLFAGVFLCLVVCVPFVFSVAAFAGSWPAAVGAANSQPLLRALGVLLSASVVFGGLAYLRVVPATRVPWWLRFAATVMFLISLGTGRALPVVITACATLSVWGLINSLYPQPTRTRSNRVAVDQTSMFFPLKLMFSW